MCLEVELRQRVCAVAGQTPFTSSRTRCIPDAQPTVAVQMTEPDILQAIRSFPAGSAGGPDGVRPQHILEMVNCRQAGPELLSALTGFVNCLLQGEIHPRMSPVLFGGNLIAHFNFGSVLTDVKYYRELSCKFEIWSVDSRKNH